MEEVTTPSMGTPVSKEALLKQGYEQYPPGIEQCECLLQKAVHGEFGRKYFITFREWDHRGELSYDAQLTCDSQSGGYVWTTVKEATIEDTERRINAIWVACGSAYYD